MCLMRVSVQVCKSQVRTSPGECAVFKSGEGASRSPPTPWGEKGDVWVSAWDWKGGLELGDHAPPSKRWVGNQLKWEKVKKGGGMRRMTHCSEKLWQKEDKKKKAEEWAKQKTMKWLPWSHSKAVHLVSVSFSFPSLCLSLPPAVTRKTWNIFKWMTHWRSAAS